VTPGRALRLWAAVVGGAVVVELVAIRARRPDLTLSAATRVACRTDTPMGRAVFVGGWAALSAWFVPHIVSPR
jgi:hypothetical protein